MALGDSLASGGDELDQNETQRLDIGWLESQNRRRHVFKDSSDIRSFDFIFIEF
jgi:hypothetical protein